MAEGIHINHEKAKEDAMGVKSAAVYLQSVPLVPQDMRTTLPANAKGKRAYSRSQDEIFRLGTLLDLEAENIRSLNVAFEEFDRMLGEFEKNGSRYPVITVRP